MKKNKIKVLLDYLPLVILIVSACILIWTIATTDIVLVWKHYVGLISIPIISFLFYKRHLFDVLSLGITLVLGMIGIISFSPAISITTFGLGNSLDWSITLLRFQPIFLLWALIHFILSGRYYFGILSKKYWQAVKDGKEYTLNNN